MTDFIIIGAGISGLSAAWFLRRRGYTVEVLEADDYLGGSIRSVDTEGFLVEAGPNSALENTHALTELINGTGLSQQLCEANPQAKRRYILKQGELLKLPGSPIDFIRSHLFSGRGKLRLLGEPFMGRADTEETIAEFVTRRLGREFLDWAIDPFISGVYAGDPSKLSVQAATRKIYALESEYGSLFIGALRRVMQGRKSGPAPAGRMISFTDGMQALPLAVANSLGAAVRPSVRVTSLHRDSDTWRVEVDGVPGPFIADRLVLAVPAYRGADLLEPLSPEAARELRTIEYPAVASIAMGFQRDQVDHPLDGFGFLIPQREQRQTLGTLFSSTLFPGRAPEGRVLLTSFIGGARNQTIKGQESQALTNLVLEEIRPILGITGDPCFERVHYWHQAIPQYQLGHNRRVERIHGLLSQFPGLYLRANWLDGISLSDCVRNGQELADGIATEFSARPSSKTEAGLTSTSGN